MKDSTWRVLECVAGGLALAAVAAISGGWIDQLCFHNVAGVDVAAPDSARGPWCEAITGRSAWFLTDLAIVAGVGFAIQLIPIPALFRWALWGFVALALLAIGFYMAHLDYYVEI
jgi:hypothetical protein